MPISEITFPNVTVCPPRNLFLNLNYDILQAEKIKLDKDKRESLIESFLDVIQDKYFNDIMFNLSKVEDPSRYYNWYYGYTKLNFPYYDGRFRQLLYEVNTYAKYGNISTQYFSNKFDAEKVDGNISVTIKVYIPTSVKGDKNTTLMLDIKKRTMEEVGEWDQMKYDSLIDADLTHWSQNITAPSSRPYTITLNRKIRKDYIQTLDLSMMPGFRFTWKYSKQLEADAIYSEYYVPNMEFAR